MADLFAFIMTNTAELYTVLFRYGYFYIDYWSFVHVTCGVLLMVMAKSLSVKCRWLKLIAILVAYELLEIAFVYLAIHIFLPEMIPDKLTDIITGVLGALAGDLLTSESARIAANKLMRRVTKESVIDFVAAFVISFLWVHYYGYRYNVSFLNSPVVNWWALTLWTLGLFAVMQAYTILSKRWNDPLALIVVWIVFLAVTLLVEFLGYSVLEIHELGGHSPLVLGLIHGTPLLKLYYVFAAPAAVTFMIFSRKIVNGYLYWTPEIRSDQSDIT